MTQEKDRIEELEVKVEQLRELVQEQDSGGTSRRKFIGGLAGGALLGASTGSASAQSGVGGGPASDELAHLRQYLYGGPLSEQDGGGVANRVYLADDGTLERDFGSGWEKADLRVRNTHSELVSADETDSDSYHAAYSVSYKPRMWAGSHANDELPRIANKTLEPYNMLTHPDREAANFTAYFGGSFNTAEEIWITTEGGGDVEFIAELPDPLVDAHDVTVTPQGDWLIFMVETDPDGTMYAFDTPSDIEGFTGDGSTELASYSCAKPFQFGMKTWYNGYNTNGVLWAEYVTGGDRTRAAKIHKYTHGGTFTEVYSDTEPYHFHGIDCDMAHDPSHFYAFSGDSGSEIKWIKSTDHGDTWSEVTEAGGSQPYRTIHINSTPDYLYWGSDTEGGALYRAPRDDLGNPEKLFDFPDSLFCYGTTRFYEPNGILIGLQDENAQGLDTIPMYFYSLENQTARKVKEWKTNRNYRDGSDDRAGVWRMPAFANQANGYASIVFRSIDVARDRVHLNRNTAEVTVTELQ